MIYLYEVLATNKAACWVTLLLYTKTVLKYEDLYGCIFQYIFKGKTCDSLYYTFYFTTVSNHHSVGFVSSLSIMRSMEAFHLNMDYTDNLTWFILKASLFFSLPLFSLISTPFVSLIQLDHFFLFSLWL